MFDFFKDVILETQGIDSEKAKKYKEEKKLNKYLISNKMKVIIFICGILYLVVTGVTLRYTHGSLGLIHIIKYIILSSISITIMVLLLTKKKKAELISLVLIIIFLIGNYLSLFIN